MGVILPPQSTHMKTLGLIGGLSWHSTIDYYRMINQRVNDRLGGVHSASLYLYSVDFEEIKFLTLSGDWTSLAKNMTSIALKLEGAGAEALVICANTMHHVANEIQSSINIPIIHIAEATASEIAAQGIHKVALLGTRFTMQYPFYHEKLKAKAILPMLPSDADIEYLNTSIYEEMGKGIFSEQTKTRVLSMIADLEQQGAQGVILGCTELPILLRDEQPSIPFFDTATIHANAAVDFALS